MHDDFCEIWDVSLSLKKSSHKKDTIKATLDGL